MVRKGSDAVCQGARGKCIRVGECIRRVFPPQADERRCAGARKLVMASVDNGGENLPVRDGIPQVERRHGAGGPAGQVAVSTKEQLEWAKPNRTGVARPPPSGNREGGIRRPQKQGGVDEFD